MSKKTGVFWHFLFNFEVFWSLCLFWAILAHQTSYSMFRRFWGIFRHPWHPWGRVNSGVNGFWVHTATVIYYSWTKLYIYVHWFCLVNQSKLYGTQNSWRKWKKSMNSELGLMPFFIKRAQCRTLLKWLCLPAKVASSYSCTCRVSNLSFSTKIV